MPGFLLEPCVVGFGRGQAQHGERLLREFLAGQPGARLAPVAVRGQMLEHDRQIASLDRVKPRAPLGKQLVKLGTLSRRAPDKIGSKTAAQIAPDHRRTGSHPDPRESDARSCLGLERQPQPPEQVRLAGAGVSV